MSGCICDLDNEVVCARHEHSPEPGSLRMLYKDTRHRSVNGDASTFVVTTKRSGDDDPYPWYGAFCLVLTPDHVGWTRSESLCS